MELGQWHHLVSASDQTVPLLLTYEFIKQTNSFFKQTENIKTPCQPTTVFSFRRCCQLGVGAGVAGTRRRMCSPLEAAEPREPQQPGT